VGHRHRPAPARHPGVDRAVIDKTCEPLARALAGIEDGMTVLVGGFGDAGAPTRLLAGVAALGLRSLTVVSNNCGTGETGVALLFKQGCVSRVLASFPTQAGSHHFRRAYERGGLEVEIVPQGTLVERLHAGAAGLGGVVTPTAMGTVLGAGKPVVTVDGETYLLERPIRGDVALVRARVADRRGNLRYRRSSRNFNPLMAMAATMTVAEVDEVVEAGELDADDVHTAGVFVDRVVHHEGGL